MLDLFVDGEDHILIMFFLFRREGLVHRYPSTQGISVHLPDFPFSIERGVVLGLDAFQAP